MISLENFQSLIQKYESTITEISHELNEYQEEQVFIKNQINELVKENTELSSELNNVFVKTTQCSGDKLRDDPDELIKNLEKQIELLHGERSNFLCLWENANSTVDKLEEQLHIYQDVEQIVAKSELTKIKKKYDEKIKTLEDQLSQMKAKQEVKNVRTEFINKEHDSTAKLKDQELSTKIVKNLEEEILSLQNRLANSERIQIQLQRTIEEKLCEIDFLKLKNKECCLKVAEALSIADTAMGEKNEIEVKEKEAKDEIEKLSKSLTELTQQSDHKIRNEIQRVRDEYEEKFKNLHQSLRSNQEEIRKKFEQIQTTNLVNIEKIPNYPESVETVNSKLLILEKNLERTFQKLLLSEKEKIQLQSEKESIKNDLSQIASYYERDINGRDTEKIVLKNELTRLQMKLEENQSMIEESNKENKKLLEQLQKMESDHQAKIAEETKSLQQKFHNEINELNQKNWDIVADLNAQIASHIEMNNKWKYESKNIADQFEKRLNELKHEITKLKMENKSMSEKLKESNNKIHEYKKFLQLLAQDVNSITKSSTDTLTK